MTTDSVQTLKCPAHSGLDQRIITLEHNRSEVWEAIDKLRNRLPVWATITISVLTFLLGICAKAAIL